MQESHEGPFLSFAEVQSDRAIVIAELRSEIGMVDDLGIVEFDDLFQGAESTIMHVGSRESDITEGGNLELTKILLPACDGTYARIRVGIFKTIIENVVRDKVISPVAVVTPSLSIEDSSPLILFRAEVGEVFRPPKIKLGFC